MDRIVLASVPFDTPLSQVLAKMRPGTRAAVVVKPGGPVLVTAGDIMDAINAQVDAKRDPSMVKVGQINTDQGRIATPPFPRPQFEGLSTTEQLPNFTASEEKHFKDAFDRTNDRRY